LPAGGGDKHETCAQCRAGASFPLDPAPLRAAGVDRVEVLQFKDKQQNPVTLAQAHLQGQLRITDAAQFRNSFTQGIGRGRTFGCGLLQIAPLLDNPFA